MRAPIPNPPPDWPSPSRIHILWAVASAVESQTETCRRLRQFLELPSDTELTESLLCGMTWQEYWTIIRDYAARACAPTTERMDADT